MQLLVLALASALAAPAADTVDLLIRGGTVVDGTGAPARRADVAVRGDRIVLVGRAADAGLVARRVVDATGLIVAPGFIDPHTHTFDDLGGAARGNVPYLMQGVTTVITGNDGGGTPRTGEALARWTREGIGTNAALLVGQGAVRQTVMGHSPAPADAAQLDSMRALVERAMRDGALGLSSGLYYAPGSFAPTEEVIALARTAAAHGGVYDTHLRDESSYNVGLLAAVAEAIRIGREAGLPVNISHVKALGVDAWGLSDSVAALVRAARARGLAVTADQYPYTASGTSVGASLLPRWAEAGGRDSLLARIRDANVRPGLVAEMQANLRRRGGPGALLITRAPDPRLVGRTLEAIATERGLAPVDAALEIIVAGDASVASFNMREADIERLMREEFVMTGSDGSAGHPRKFGTYPRKLRRYVIERRVLTLEQAVRAATSLPAQTFRLADRGVLAPGRFADVVVFDLDRIADRSTFEQPERLAEGVEWVLVNGVVAVERGRPTDALAGRALRGTGARPR